MATYDKKYKSIAIAGGRIRRTIGGRFVAERSDGGRIRRVTFDTEQGSKTYLQNLGKRRDKHGQIATALTADQTRDAIDAFHRLENAGLNTTLCELADNHIERNTGTGSDITIADLFHEHIEDLKTRRRKRTWVDKENRLNSFKDMFGSMSLAEITFQEVKGWLESTGHTGRNLRNDQIAVQSFFNWCDAHTERKAREQGNPSLHWHNDVAVFPASDWETSDNPAVGTVSNADALAVLRRLEELDPESALVLALGLLAGLRTSEIVEKDGLRWQDIDLGEREITVTKTQSKTKHGRTVPINDILLAWLVRYQKDSGRIGRRFNAFRKYRSQACQDVGIEWPHNAARHTFASNFCKVHGERKAADALGHVGSVDMLLDHYRGVMQSKAKARAYFEILTPAGTEKKVLRMEEAS